MRADLTRTDPPISRDDLGQASAHVRSLYDNGTALFNKQEIRRIGHQLAEASAGGETCFVPVNGFDGRPVEFEVQIGRISPAIGSRSLDSIT